MTTFDPSEHTVEEVQAHLEEHPEQTAEVIEAEKAGKDRKSLIEGPSTRLVTFGRKSPESGALEIQSE